MENVDPARLAINIDNFNVSPLEMKDAVKDLKRGKGAGLLSENYTYTSDKLNVLIALTGAGVLPHMWVQGCYPNRKMKTHKCTEVTSKFRLINIPIYS